MAKSVDTLKKFLKTHLFSKAFSTRFEAYARLLIVQS